MTKPETSVQERFLRGLFALLAPVVPLLIGYDIYFQLRVSVLDFSFSHTGLVYDVPFESYADWAGLLPGDVILTADGIPFSDWLDHGLFVPSDTNYMMIVERDGQSLTIEMPNIPMAKTNWLSLGSAVATALIFWGVGILLLLRRFRQPEVRLLFPLSQAFAIVLLFPQKAAIAVFGPRVYSRGHGCPVFVLDGFAGPGLAGDAFLCIDNGTPDGDNRVTSALVAINGEMVAGPSDFNHDVERVQKSIS